MIRIFVGNIGSGKSLSAIRVMKLRNQHTFCNQGLKFDKAHRMKVTDIVEQVIDEPEEGSKAKAKTRLEVNWKFWVEQTTKYKHYDIFLDEIASFMGARNSMTGFSKKAMEWIAQIRKILGESELNDIILVSQKLDGIDITIRDFAHEITHCQKFYTIDGQLHPASNRNVHDALHIPTKVWSGESGKRKLVEKMIPKVTIVQWHFEGEYAVNDFFAFRFQRKKTYSKKTWFCGNPFIQYYDSYEILDFAPTTYL